MRLLIFTVITIVTLVGCCDKSVGTPSIHTEIVKVPVYCNHPWCIKPTQGNFKDPSLTLSERAMIK